jgi:dienelactone hydrolase
MKKIILFLLLTSTFCWGQTHLITTKNLPANLLWDLKELSKPPKVEWLKGIESVRSLLLQSVNYEGKPTQVFAYYSNPDLIQGKAPSKKKFPGIVLIHGGGGTAFKQWVEKWAADGYAAIAMDLSGNGADGKKIAKPGADQADTNKFEKIDNSDLKDVWTYHAVSSILLAHSWLLNLPEVDANRTAVTGISWGGYLTCIVGSLDNRFKAAVPVYGCAYYDGSDFFKHSLARLSPAGREKWMQHFDPSSYLPYAQPQFLFVNGNKDRFYNVVPYDKTYKLLEEKQRSVCIIPDMKHSHDWGWEPHEIRYFIESVLNKTSPLPKVGPVVRKGNQLTTTYSSPVSLWTAELYYSNDTTSTNEERVWHRKGARFDPATNTISCPVPQEGFAYGFFYFRDHRNITASSEFIFP